MILHGGLSMATLNTKYIYAYYSPDLDDQYTYIYRMDEDGNIVFAEINDDQYTYADLAEIPRRVMETFSTVAKRRDEGISTERNSPPSWSLPTSDSDEGITLEEFIELVLTKIPNSSFDNTNGRFFVSVVTASGYKQISIPNRTLKLLAQNNKFFDTSYYWMA